MSVHDMSLWLDLLMTEFQKGVKAMARSCQSAIRLIERGNWKPIHMQEWLQAVIDQDPHYLDKAIDRSFDDSKYVEQMLPPRFTDPPTQEEIAAMPIKENPCP
jgi:hypothetical protein